jgi:hypothetical protein
MIGSFPDGFGTRFISCPFTTGITSVGLPFVAGVASFTVTTVCTVIAMPFLIRFLTAAFTVYV